MSSKLIYVADDEIYIQDLIRMFLEKEGYKVMLFSNGLALLETFRTKPADMVILDIMMPGLDGMTLCSELRKESQVPIIIVSAKDSESDKIAGFLLGSDDYLSKPFSPVELVLRAKSIFKRMEMEKQSSGHSEPLQLLDLTINPQARTAYHLDKDLRLTPLEFNLLLYLANNQDKGVSREELLTQVWGFDSEVDTRATDDTIKRLRKKLSGVGSAVKIETIWGFGFKI